jgi:hypothetical protein
MPGKVILVRKDGSKFETTPEKAKFLVESMGYREESPEELMSEAAKAGEQRYHEQPIEKALTVAEGWAGTATLGVADKLNPDIEGARQRAKFNPVHRMGGEMGAAILGSVIAPGMGARTVGGRVAAEAGAGFAFGAGNALTDSALSGDPLTVGSVLAHGGVGALLGTGTGLAGEAVIGVAGKLKSKRAAGEAVEDIFNPSANRDYDSFFTAKEFKPGPKGKKNVPDWVKAGKEVDDEYIREFTEDFVPQVGKTVKETYDFVPPAEFQKYRRNLADISDLYETTLKGVEDDLLTKQKELRNINKYLGGKGKDARKVGKVSDAFNRSVMDSPDNAVQLAQQYKVFRHALKEKDTVTALRQLKNYRNRIQEEAGEMVKFNKDLPSIKEVESRLAQITELEEVVKVKGAARELSTFPESAEQFSRMSTDRAERLFASADVLVKQPEPIFKSALNSIDEMLFASGISKSGTPGERMRALYEMVKSGEFKETATKRVFNPGTPIKKERAVFELPNVDSAVPSPTSAPSKPVKRADDTFSGSLMEDTMDFGIDSPAPSNVIKGTKQGGYTSKANFWSRLTRPVGARKASELARHAGMGTVGSGLAYGLGGQMVDAVLTGGLIAGVAGAKAAVIGRISSGVAKYGPGLGKGIKKLGGRVDPLYTRIDGTIEARKEDDNRKDALKRRIDEINAIGPGAKDAAFFAVQPLLNDYPEFAKGLHDAFITAFNGLVSFLPRDPGTATNRGKSLWKPSDIQLRTVEKALAVFHDPMGAIESILSGVADMTTVRALETMYPPIYEEMRMGLISRMTDPTFLNSLSYDDQARLFVMTQVPLHSSFTPRSIAQSQSIYARATQNRPAPTNSGGGSGGRPQKMEPPTAGQSLAGK